MTAEWEEYHTEIVKVNTISIESIMEKMPVCDLLSIDLEGYDVKVLEALNFRKYRPKIIVVEMLQGN